MSKLTIYTRATIDGMIVDQLGATNHEAWRARVLPLVAKMVRDRPRVYRTFGPLWWPVKAQMVKAKLMAGEVDPDEVARVSTGNDVADLMAALAYHGFNVDSMSMGNVFSVNTEDGDTVDYTLIDAEFEV